jgi:hypothetical protein
MKNIDTRYEPFAISGSGHALFHRSRGDAFRPERIISRL